MAGLDRDLDDLLSAPVERPYKKCSVGYLLEQLPESERIKLARILDAGVVPSSQLAAMLKRNGYDVRDANIARHRRRLMGAAGCSCP